MDLIPDNVAGFLADLVLVASVIAAIFYLTKRILRPFYRDALRPFLKGLIRFGQHVIDEEDKHGDD